MLDDECQQPLQNFLPSLVSRCARSSANGYLAAVGHANDDVDGD